MSTPVKKSLYDKSLAATANLARLLPTGPTLAFQTLVPSFTNHGTCVTVNRVFSWGLVGFLGLLCAVLSFTDSITDSDGNTHYGLALPTSRGFYVFNYNYENKKKKNGGQQTQGNNGGPNGFESDCNDRRVRPRDFIHAFFRALVFLSLAFGDNELQSCLIGESRMTDQWKEFLVNMPLATGFLASFVFVIFPSNRKGIGYDVDTADSSPSDQQSKGGGPGCSLQITKITDVAQVVPPTSYELDPIV